MVLTDAGEDMVALSDNGDYAANTERATAAPLPAMTDEMRPLEEVHTPDKGTIDEVCGLLGTQPSEMIKTLIFVEATERPSDQAKKADDAKFSRDPKGSPSRPRVVVALIRGDHELNEYKMAKLVDGPLEMANESVIREVTDAAVGFAGPQGLADKIDRMIVDPAVVGMRNACTGANKTDYHVRNVNPGRDFPLETPAGSRCQIVVADIRTVVDGDPSPTGSGSPLHLRKAIEVGHVFKLGTKYSDALKAHYLDKNGKARPFIMGCYGIGLNRIMAAAIESHHDDGGIVWPMSIAPFEVLVVALDPRNDEVMKTAGGIHDALAADGVDVLFDERDERAGFKFKDADLIGIPVRIVIGKKSVANGVVELSRREAPKDVETIAPEQAAARAAEMVRAQTGRSDAHGTRN